MILLIISFYKCRLGCALYFSGNPGQNVFNCPLKIMMLKLSRAKSPKSFPISHTIPFVMVLFSKQRCTFMWRVSKLLYVLEFRLLSVKDITLEHSMFTGRLPSK